MLTLWVTAWGIERLLGRFRVGTDGSGRLYLGLGGSIFPRGRFRRSVVLELRRGLHSEGVPSFGSFCCNGLVNAVREPHPHLFAVKKYINISNLV